MEIADQNAQPARASRATPASTAPLRLLKGSGMAPSKKEIPVVQVAQPTSSELPAEFQHLLEWLGTGLERMEGIEDERTREEVLALLEGIDVLHRQALGRLLDLVGTLGGRGLAERVSEDPIVRTLLEMYDLPEADERTQVER